METARSRRSKNTNRAAPASALTPRLTHNEIDLDTLLAALGDDVYVLDAEGRFLIAAGKHKTFRGQSIEVLLGRRLHDVLPAAYADQALALVRRALDLGQPLPYEYNFEWEGRNLYLSGSLIPLAGERVLGVVRDTTEPHRLEALSEIQRHVLELIATGQPLQMILGALVNAVEGRSPGMLCSMHLLEPDGQRLRTAIAPSLPEAFSRRIDGIPVGPQAGSCGTAVYRRETVIVTDIQADPLWDAGREAAAEFGLRACWSRPIVATSGRVLGSLAMYHREVHAPEPYEVRLIESAAHLASIALERQEREDALRSAEHAEHRRAAELEAVREATLGLTQQLQFPAVLDDVLRAVFGLMEGVKNAHIFIYDADTDTLSFGSAVRDDAVLVKPWVQPRSNGLTFSVARSGKMIVVSDMNTHPLFVDAPYQWGGAIVGFPLKIGDRVVGVMNVAYAQPHYFSDWEIRRLTLLADQAAIAIDNARLFEAERAANAEAEALRQISGSLLMPGLTRDQVLSVILEQLARVVEYDSASIMLVQQASLTMAAHRGLRAETQVVIGSFQLQTMQHLQDVIGQRQAAIIPDTEADPRWQKFDDPEADYIRCWLGAPLIVKDAVIGVLNLDKIEPHYYTQRHARLALAFATQAALAIEHSRLYSALAQEAQRLERLNQLSRNLSARLDPEQVYVAIHRAAERLMPCDMFGISLISESRQLVNVIYQVDKGKRYPAFTFPIQRGLSGRVIDSGESLRIDDLHALEPLDAVHYGNPDRTRSLLMVPMFLENRVVGALSAQSYSEYRYSAEEEHMLGTLGQQAAIAIENARLYAETQSQLNDQTLLYECAHALALVHDTHAAMSIVCDFVCRRFEATSMAIYRYDADTQTCGIDFEYWAEGATEPERRSALGLVTTLENHPSTAKALETRSPQVVRADDPNLPPAERRSLESFDGKTVIAVPLVRHDRVTGFFDIWNSREIREYTERDRRLLMALSALAATALENTRLYAATRRQSLELSTLIEAARMVSSFQKLDEVIEHLARHMAQATGALGCTISKWDREQDAVVTWVTWRQRNVEFADAPGTVYPLSRYPTTRKVLEHRRHRIVTVDEEASEPSEARLLRDVRVSSVLMLPLVVGADVIGLVEVFEDAPGRRFTADEINLVQGMVNQAAVAITNAQLFGAVAQEKERLQLLYDLSQNLADTLDPAEVGSRALARMCPVFGAFQGAVYVIEPRTGRLQLAALTDDQRLPELDRRMNLHVGEGLSGWVAQERALVIVDDVADDERWVPVAGLDDRVRSVIAAPLIAAGQLVGVINLSSDRRGAFRSEQSPAFAAAAGPVAAALHNARLFEDARIQANEMREASTILHALNASPEVNEAFATVVAGLKQITRSVRVSLALLEDGGQAVRMAALDQPRPELDKGATFPVGATAAADDVLAGRLHLTPDLSAETGYPIELRLYEAGYRSRINVPLQVGERIIGALNLVWLTTDGYSQTNLGLMRQIADALALAIEKNRFFDESRRRDAILESLAYGSQCLLMPGNLADNLIAAMASLGRVIGVSRVYVFENHIGSNGQLLASRRYEWCADGVSSQLQNEALQNQPYTGPFDRWGKALGAGRPLYGLVREFPSVEQPVLLAQQILSMAIVPIFSGGAWWGFLGFDDCLHERVWDQAAIEALKSAAATLGAAFARQRSETAEREQRALAQALRDTASALNSTLNFDEVLDRILENVGRVVPHDAANVLLIDSDQRQARVVRRIGYLKHRGFDALAIRLDMPAAPNLQAMVTTQRPYIIADTQLYAGWVQTPETEWVRSYLGAPIVVRGQVIGFLNVDSLTPGFFTQTHGDHLMAFANEAAVAIQNAQLFAATQRHVRNATLLNEITRAALEATDYTTGLQTLADQLGRLIHADGCYITLWDERFQRPIPTAAYGAHSDKYAASEPRSLPGELTLTASVLKHGRPLIVDDFRRSPHISQRLVGAYKDFPLHSVLCLPLTVGETKLGAVLVSFGAPHQFSEEEVTLGEQAAGQVALAIFKGRLIEDERTQRVMAEALRDTAGALISTLNFDDVLERILANVGRVVPHDSATIMLADDLSRGIDLQAGRVRVVRARGFRDRGLEAWVLDLHFDVAASAKMRQMVELQQPLLIADTQASSEWIDLPETRWIKAYVGAPIVVRGRVTGFINLDSATPGFFTARHAERLQVFANQAAVAIENAFLYDSIRQNADELAVLYRASAQLIRPGADLDAVATQIVEAVSQAFGVSRCALFVMDDTGANLHAMGRGAGPSLAIPLRGTGMVVEAARTHQPVYATGNVARTHYLELDRDTGSAMAAPMLIGERVIGVLRLESASLEAFDRRVQRMVMAFAERAALAIENSQLVARLDRARRTAEEASQLKSEFLANTSHELRTPLTGIIGSLSVIIDNRAEDEAEQRDLIQIAYSSSEHLLQIINDVLDVAKIEAGRMTVTSERVGILPLFVELHALMRVQAEEKKLRLDLHAPEDLSLKVWADPEKLHQVLVNLIGNAIKFTERGGVTVRATPDGAWMVFTVQDTGIGIAPEKQGKLFSPFVQADGSTTRKYGGTGLGLSIARRLAEMMGGTLSLFSEGEGRGTTMTLKLHLAKE